MNVNDFTRVSFNGLELVDVWNRWIELGTIIRNSKGRIRTLANRNIIVIRETEKERERKWKIKPTKKKKK